MNKKVAIILINYKEYSRKYLLECIVSIRKQGWQGEKKVFIVDNQSSSESYQYLAKTVPEAELILNKTNDGFAKGNNDAIKQAMLQGFDYIILFNMDTVIEKNCVSKMVKVAEQNNKAGAVQARLMLWPKKEKINSLGNVTHFLGFGYCEGYGEVWSNNLNHCHCEEESGAAISGVESVSPRSFRSLQSLRMTKGGSINIFYPSGAAVLFKREVLEKVGLFDEEFWMYNEDQDLGWRIWLAGYKCVLAPDAVVYHKYEFAKSIKQYYWMDRNRIIAICKNYHALTILLITPACLVMELGLIIFAIKGGWFKEKMKVYAYFLNPLKWLYLWQARQEAQKLRKIRDKKIIKMISGKILYQEIDSAALRLANIVFNLYWKLIRKLIVW